MDCVEGPQRRLGECPGTGEQSAVQRAQRDRPYQFARPFQ
jgi:hypothetical protein